MKRSMESRKELVRVVLLLATVVGHIFPEERGLRDVHLAEPYVSQHIIPERDPGLRFSITLIHQSRNLATWAAGSPGYVTTTRSWMP